ncbi:hypothetical protein M0813_17260 [Anaeramoeba flamelloides]|uniref:Uncharacterized protein n=1 Tax=Anaeramoeba flamelloides TaxID=1746091 RepID=A0ABQ8YWE3_9EUKA|nr:hypothetical protein M0813_17260 [Anaeramoeba flamelloides]
MQINQQFEKREKEKNVKGEEEENLRRGSKSTRGYITEEEQYETNNYNFGSHFFQKDPPFQSKDIEIVKNKSKKHNIEKIILQNQKHINHIIHAQEELKINIQDLFLFIKENFESIHQTQNQLFELIGKKQNDHKKLNQQNTAILDPTFIENLTNTALQTTHIMRKLVLLKIKAIDGFGKLRLPQPNEARKVSRCLQVRLCKQKSHLLQYFEKQIFTKPFLIENSNERKHFFTKIPKRFFDPVYNEMSYSVKQKCLNFWLTDFLTTGVFHEKEKEAENFNI